MIEAFVSVVAPLHSPGDYLERFVREAGDVLGVVAGTQMASGSTNFMRLHVVEGKS